jgi:hypothetical protein
LAEPAKHCTPLTELPSSPGSVASCHHASAPMPKNAWPMYSQRRARTAGLKTSIHSERGISPFVVAASALPTMPWGLDHTEIMYLKWLV